MKIAIYGRITGNTDFEALFGFFRFLRAENISYVVYDEYARNLMKIAPVSEHPNWLSELFSSAEEIQDCDFLFSFGGDGTMLDAVRLVKRLSLPALGVNVGRLGFLADVSQEELVDKTKALLRGDYTLEERAMLQVYSDSANIFGDYNYAVNEITLHKSNSNEMIVIHTYINDLFLNSYWTDGLIVSTPTGSTAYSLACGGPIIVPRARALVVTPIAPHSLTVRPVVVPEDSVISFKIESRSGQALVALDNRNEIIDENVNISVKKAEQVVRLVKFKDKDYFGTLRERLNWGVDSRN